MRDIKQIKLTTGEELVCDVLELVEDEYAEAMVVTNCLTILCQEDRKREIRWYTFRPFMLHQDADQQLVINTQNIVCLTTPAKGVMDYFNTYLDNFRKIKKEEEDFVRENMDITFSEDDSDLNNLIRFPGPKPDRVH